MVLHTRIYFQVGFIHTIECRDPSFLRLEKSGSATLKIISKGADLKATRVLEMTSEDKIQSMSKDILQNCSTNSPN